MRRPMTFRRFATGAEAIRYAMEVLDAESLGGAIVETDQARLGAGKIRELYDCSDYPLPRQKIS